MSPELEDLIDRLTFVGRYATETEDQAATRRASVRIEASLKLREQADEIARLTAPDPDLLEAREVCFAEDPSPKYLTGELDHQVQVQAAFAAIKRGRKLERVLHEPD